MSKSIVSYHRARQASFNIGQFSQPMEGMSQLVRSLKNNGMGNLSKSAQGLLNQLEALKEKTRQSVESRTGSRVPTLHERRARIECPPVITEEDLEEWEAGEGQWSDPKVKRAWKGYEVNVTFSLVTLESAEEGDAAEHGYEERGTKFDSLEELTDHYGTEHTWLEWSNSSPGPGDWITSEAEEDYSDGSSTTYSLHITRGDGEDLTREEIKYLEHELGV